MCMQRSVHRHSPGLSGMQCLQFAVLLSCLYRFAVLFGMPSEKYDQMLAAGCHDLYAAPVTGRQRELAIHRRPGAVTACTGHISLCTRYKERVLTSLQVCVELLGRRDSTFNCHLLIIKSTFLMTCLCCILQAKQLSNEREAAIRRKAAALNVHISPYMLHHAKPAEGPAAQDGPSEQR